MCKDLSFFYSISVQLWSVFNIIIQKIVLNVVDVVLSTVVL